MATYPMTYMPGYYAPPAPKARTPQGIRWSLIAFVIYLGFLIVSTVLSLIVAGIYANLSSGDLSALLTTLLLLLLVGLVTVVFAILVLVFYFIGFGYLYAGRNEFGPAHARNVRLSLYLLIAALAVYVTGGVASFIISFSQFSFTSTQINVGAFYLSAAVGAVIQVAVAALVAALLVLSARALARPEHQKFLYAAAGLGTVTPGIVGALTLIQLARFLQVLQGLQGPGGMGSASLDPGMGVPTLAGGVLGLITFLLYIVVYRDVAMRLRTGDLKPVLPQPMPMMPWMPGPVVPPYPVPAAPPPIPPAQPGPSGPAP